MSESLRAFAQRLVRPCKHLRVDPVGCANGGTPPLTCMHCRRYAARSAGRAMALAAAWSALAEAVLAGLHARAPLRVYRVDAWDAEHVLVKATSRASPTGYHTRLVRRAAYTFAPPASRRAFMARLSDGRSLGIPG